MKKYLVIGNPIKHSLSPELHNHWIKQNQIDAIYEKKELNHNELENLILDIKKENMHGVNITVPFKSAIIPYIDELSDEARKTQSVNTIYLQNKKVVHRSNLSKLRPRCTSYGPIRPYCDDFGLIARV